MQPTLAYQLCASFENEITREDKVMLSLSCRVSMSPSAHRIREISPDIILEISKYIHDSVARGRMNPDVKEGWGLLIAGCLDRFLERDDLLPAESDPQAEQWFEWARTRVEIGI